MAGDELQAEDAQSNQTGIAEAMVSGNSERVAGALKELRDTVPPLQERVPPPAPEIWDAFPNGVPGAVVRDYIWVLANYSFTPPLAPDEKVRRWTEAVLRSADGAAALQLVLYLRGDKLPTGADVTDVISYVATRGVRPGGEAQGAEYLARYLLDHSQTYARAVRALVAWKDVPLLQGILEQVAPYVHVEDRMRLGLG